MREPNRPTLDQATATETIARWSGLFLRANLLGDHGASNAVFNANAAFDPNVSIISQHNPDELSPQRIGSKLAPIDSWIGADAVEV